jgi:hypothetical protein
MHPTLILSFAATYPLPPNTCLGIMDIPASAMAELLMNFLLECFEFSIVIKVEIKQL